MIVLDTHVIIWDALQPERLSNLAQQAIAQANRTNGILICNISLWEIAMLMHKGRLKVDVDYRTFINLVLQANRYIIQPITPEIAEVATNLPEDVGRDPVDRLIVATTIVQNTSLVTADQYLQQARNISTLW